MNLRWLKKADGSRVLQHGKPWGDGIQHADWDWADIPTVEQEKKPREWDVFPCNNRLAWDAFEVYDAPHPNGKLGGIRVRAVLNNEVWCEGCRSFRKIDYKDVKVDPDSPKIISREE